VFSTLAFVQRDINGLFTRLIIRVLNY